MFCSVSGATLDRLLPSSRAHDITNDQSSCIYNKRDSMKISRWRSITMVELRVENVDRVSFILQHVDICQVACICRTLKRTKLHGTTLSLSKKAVFSTCTLVGLLILMQSHTCICARQFTKNSNRKQLLNSTHCITLPWGCAQSVQWGRCSELGATANGSGL